MPSSDHIIEHPTLGCSLLGKPSTTSVQFRNLKYASIPGRYKESIPNDTLKTNKNGVFDATIFGPSCPQKQGSQVVDLLFYGDVALPYEHGQGESEKSDEFDCLHVNVTVPKSAIKARRPDARGLPVLVWVHGGGLRVGSNSWPQYDLQKWVDRSVKIGKPFIGVSVNYRLALLGFLAVEELGAMGNMGFKDQALAFRWVKKHIAGFGGDPNNITAAGESAGGISLSTLLCANIGDKGLFEKVIIMSGEITLRKPRNRWWHKKFYLDQAKHFGLPSKDTAELRSQLLATSTEELARKLPLADHNCGYVDGDWLSEDITVELLANGNRIEHKPTWCREFVIGDCAHDGTVLKARILDQPRPLEQLKAICSKHLTSQETRDLLVAYNLDKTLSSEKQQHALLCLASELRFYNPARQAYNGWKSTQPPRNAQQYHFHVPNPFKGGLNGLASHELDVAFLLQNFNNQLDESGRNIAKAMADHFTKYIHGEPWATESKLIVFGENGVVEVSEDEYDQLYRNGRGKVLDTIGQNKLWRVAEEWQGVRSEEEELESNVKL